MVRLHVSSFQRIIRFVLGRSSVRRWSITRTACVVLALCLTLAMAACSSEPKLEGTVQSAPTPAEGAAPWPAPPYPLEFAIDAGLEPATHEFLDYHVHAHLDVFVNGERVVVPAGIGIDITDPEVRQSGTGANASYGDIQECADPCISPLHTHDTTGVLHTESPTDQPNTLGEFFIEWGVRLDNRCVGGYCEPDANIAIFVDGDLREDDPAAIELMDQEEIAIVVGTPPEHIPSSYEP